MSLHKTALITGASRGIGAGIAEALARDGYDLVLTCLENVDRLETLAAQLRDAYGISVLTAKCDASDYAQVEELAGKVRAEFSHVDVIVNNAGISVVGLITDLTPEEWDRVIRTNLSAAFYTTKAFLPGMIHEKSGRIVNISSMWGTVGASCEVAYSASKGGLNTYTKALAKELAPSHIAVNAIACGVIDTDMNKIFDEEERAALAEEIPYGRFATPEEVGEAVSGLLKMPAYVTGQIIGMDGGYI